MVFLEHKKGCTFNNIVILIVILFLSYYTKMLESTVFIDLGE